MAAILMLGDVPVAEWSGAGNPPWPISFEPDGFESHDSGVLLSWPIYSGMEFTLHRLEVGSRGSPVPLSGLTVLTPFYIYRIAYLGQYDNRWGSGSHT